MSTRHVWIALVAGCAASAEVEVEVEPAPVATDSTCAVLDVRGDVDSHIVDKIVNTARATGTELVARAEPRCARRIVVTSSEITVNGTLVATVESVLRDDSPTFKIDALHMHLGARIARDAQSTETYIDHGRNPWVRTARDWQSTFAADVDGASYTIARRKLGEGTLPPAASVRVEEFVNYFRYAFPAPEAGSPFSVVMDAAPSPFLPDRHVLRVGVATVPRAPSARPPVHLVFLVDVSGSMAAPDKLGLAQRALRILTRNLSDADTITLVTYAGSTGVVLEPTSARDAQTILAAIDELSAGGSTAMASGIDLAYERAVATARRGQRSRVIILSDGDANVGSTSHEEILTQIASRAAEGVTLSTIGVGMGNYNDGLMEQLADRGNGNNYYVDSVEEATRIFADNLGATIDVVAKDVKLQVDFNPALVERYRLVGYENRDVADVDFRDDAVDGGELGAGHQVTALYELELTAFGRYLNLPLGAVRIRHEAPDQPHATERSFAMPSGAARAFAGASRDFRFAYATAAFADVLRGGTDAQRTSLAAIRAIAGEAVGPHAERAELVTLIDRAARLRGDAQSGVRSTSVVVGSSR